VLRVIAGGSAESAGIRAGDFITAIAGVTVGSTLEFVNEVRTH
jgi:S1-C subfamily serine protease